MTAGITCEEMIVALDVPDLEAAVALVGRLRGVAGSFKVGLELFNAAGPAAFQAVREAGATRIFYDAKLHDIPNTVTGACRALARHGLWLVNVHTLGGVAMMRAARQGAEEGAAAAGCAPPRILGVTLVTSLGEQEVREELGLSGPPAVEVLRLAALARNAGLAGVVASAHEAAAIRAECGPDFLIVTPGIRFRISDFGFRISDESTGTVAGQSSSDPRAQIRNPKSEIRNMDDQKRVMTPAEAIREGADFLVVGRAVTAARDPRAAAAVVAAEIAAARGSER